MWALLAQEERRSDMKSFIHFVIGPSTCVIMFDPRDKTLGNSVQIPIIFVETPHG